MELFSRTLKSLESRHFEFRHFDFCLENSVSSPIFPACSQFFRSLTFSITLCIVHLKNSSKFNLSLLSQMNSHMQCIMKSLSSTNFWSALRVLSLSLVWYIVYLLMRAFGKIFSNPFCIIFGAFPRQIRPFLLWERIIFIQSVKQILFTL